MRKYTNNFSIFCKKAILSGTHETIVLFFEHSEQVFGIEQILEIRLLMTV